MSRPLKGNDMIHETITAAAPFDLFSVEPKLVGHDQRPRSATQPEALAYAKFLAERSGLPTFGKLQLNCRHIGRDPVYIGATFGGDNDDGAYSVIFPGAGREVVTLERLNDAGEVVGSSTMPTGKKREVVWKQETVRDLVGAMPKVKRQARPKPAMSDREAMEHYCATRSAEIRAERAGTLECLIPCFEAIVGAAQTITWFPDRVPEYASEPQAPETPLTAPVPETAVERHDIPAPYALASEAQDETEAEAMAKVGDYIGGIVGDLMRRVADLEARAATPSVESKPAATMHANSDKMDGAPRRTPARERLIRRYLAMRQRRDLDRGALEAANSHARSIEAERDALKARHAKPLHQNEADVGLVTQLADERLAHQRTRENDRTPGLTLAPYRGTGSAVARVSFGGAR
jgi:hypothetical protein